MATAIVFTLYVLVSMIICFVFSKTKIGKKTMKWMLDKLTMKWGGGEKNDWREDIATRVGWND